MRNISKLAYLLGLPVLAGMFVIGFMNVAMGSVFISIPSSMDLHRPQLKKLLLGATSNGASVEVDVENNRLNIANGLVMGQNNVVAATAKFVSIGGGINNTISAVEKSGIGGGNGNLVDSSCSVIGGGSDNIVKSDSKFNAVAGGYSNVVGYEGSIVGGEKNQVYGNSVVVGGHDNYVEGDGSMILGSNSQGGARSFSWNSSILKDDSAIIMTDKGTLVGTYDPVTGVNLVVEGAVKIGTGLLSGNIGEIRMQSGCFYGYDGGMWRVINKKSGDGCPKVVCSVGSFLLQPGDSMQVYRQPYSLNCSNALQTGYCNADGTFGTPGVQYYAYCYELSGGVWSAEETAECGSANGRVYVNSPTASDGLCARGSYSSIDNQNTIFAWTCTNGSSVVNCSATRIYSCEGVQPVGPGVVLGENTQIYSPSLASWTPVSQGVAPGACQWTCEAGYHESGGVCVDALAQCGPANGGEFVTEEGELDADQVKNHILKDEACAGGDIEDVEVTIEGFTWKCVKSASSADCGAARLYYAELQGDNEEMNKFEYGIINLGGMYIMDRNLGANKKCNPDGGFSYNPDCMGYFYEWGNGFGFSKDETCRIEPLDEGEMARVCDYLGGGNVKPSSCVNPEFVCTKDGPWYYDPDYPNVKYDFWGAQGSNKDKQGPCPEGWHVPSVSDINKMLDIWESEHPGTCTFDEFLSFPSAGLHTAYKDPMLIPINFEPSDLSYLYGWLQNVNGYRVQAPEAFWLSSVAKYTDEPVFSHSVSYRKLFATAFNVKAFTVSNKCEGRIDEDMQNALTELGLSVRCFKNN